VDNPALRAVEASKVFNEGQHNEVRAIQEVSMEVGEGKCVVLEGPSGSGKTTLLSLLGCMNRPTNGRIFVEGEDVSKLSERFLALKRRQDIGVVFQHFNLVEDLSAMRNVEIPLLPTGTRRKERHRVAGELLEKFGIRDKAGFDVELLSGGEKQRVALARALVNDPAIIVADEPTAHLDTGLTKDLMGEFSKLKEEGRTMVLCTHDPIITEQDFVDRTLHMRDGRIHDS